MAKGRFGSWRRSTLVPTLGGALATVAACGSAAVGPAGAPDSPASPGRGDSSQQLSSTEVEVPADAVGPSRTPPALPRGRAVADLDGAACLELLDVSQVQYEVIPADEAEGVLTPIRLVGPVAGLELSTRGRNGMHSIMDCRVAVALLVWSETLTPAGVRGIVHMSIYRPNARVRRSGGRSGHARGLALDVGALILEDGTVLEVEEVWTDRRRRAPPCEPREEDSEQLRLLRTLFCVAAESDLFQIVLTPHFDRAHRNHVHVELRPDYDWSTLH